MHWPCWRNPVRSLRGQLATAFAGLALLAIFAGALYTGSTLRGLLLEDIAQDLDSEAHEIASAVAPPLAAGDAAAVAEYVSRVDPDTTVHIVVVDAQGSRVATTDPAPEYAPAGRVSLREALAGRSLGPTPVEGGTGHELLQEALPITTSDGRIVGAIRASYNLDDVQYVLWRLNITTLIGAVGAAVLAAGLGFAFATSVTRPVQRVVRAARELAEGQHGPPLPMPRGGTDELRTMAQAFNSLVHQLAVHERARKEFASDVSHELHALASAMQTAADALERGAADQDPALGRRLVAGLVSHTRRLNRLADDLLQLARWEAGRLRIESADLDVADLVHGTVDEWAGEVQQSGVALQVSVPDSALPARGDRARLMQALGNLVENALKYAGVGGRVSVHVGVSADQRRYEISVADSGPGIPQDVLPRVFERYFRVEGRVGGGRGGMGLGLAIARSIARAHGGDLVADSSPGEGARFVLRLPIHSAKTGTSGRPPGLRGSRPSHTPVAETA